MPLSYASADRRSHPIRALKVGTAYSISEAKQSLRQHPEEAREPNREFCIRFVAQAFAEAGISLLASPDYCTPKEIQESALLVRVEGCIRQATQEEEEYGQEPSPILTRQTEMHNHILQAARDASGQDIQTFEQLEDYLLQHPEMDGPFDQALQESGYITMWQYDCKKNPEYYSFDDFEQRVPEARRVAQAAGQLRMALHLGERFTPELVDQYEFLSWTGSRYFHTMSLLYQKLYELNQLRLRTAAKALRKYGQTLV